LAEHNTITDPYIHEPKGVATAGIGQIYVADGAGGGTWADTNAYSEVALDLTGTLTRSFAGVTAYTDFILDYITEHEKVFSYDDTTKEMTYNGVSSIITQVSFSMAIKRTDTGGSPEMTVAAFVDTGTGFNELTSSRMARSFTGNDVGSFTVVFMHTFNTGDKMKMQVKTDAGINILLRNLNWSTHFISIV